MADTATRKETAITAQNMFTAALPVSAGESVMVHASGTFVATWEIQVAEPGASTWSRLEGATFSAAGAWFVKPGVDCQVRAGVPTGGFTSGTLNMVVSTNNWRKSA